ncbi:hypothetical protein OsI_09564 [Oryza sativa Indica Group]|uniref:Uncharacterized protein n=1 Tax=Oryza sativa subsp. indica TaxID=39946 RepID=B8AFK1_ORYSI|nr:hypothetical protein OsI_09564 [Oryza sativa Indica Group]
MADAAHHLRRRSSVALPHDWCSSFSATPQSPDHHHPRQQQEERVSAAAACTVSSRASRPLSRCRPSRAPRRGSGGDGEQRWHRQFTVDDAHLLAHEDDGGDEDDSEAVRVRPLHRRRRGAATTTTVAAADLARRCKRRRRPWRDGDLG